MPTSPADSTCSVASRERDFSWSSIYVTPRKPLPPTPHTRHHQHAQLADLDARGAQRAARRWCHAQFLAAAATGVFFALGPPALLAACRSSWRAFALALLCWSAGGALPPPRGSLRAAFAARLVLWAVAAPALWLALGSDHIGGRRALGGATSDAVGLAAACLLLFADGAAAAVPAARAGADGARIEQHLQQERGVLLPIALARLLRRRHRAAREAGRCSSRPSPPPPPSSAPPRLAPATRRRGSPSSPPPPSPSPPSRPPPPPTPPPPRPASSARRGWAARRTRRACRPSAKFPRRR